ncbi:PKD domain-containing protein [Candidatus Poribacteria bacterium]|nr:PKD domain-containing protein [Candidatus Poribacteria bacterium]
MRIKSVNFLWIKSTLIFISVSLLLLLVNNSYGFGIPQPYYTLWGRAYVDNVQLTREDDQYVVSLKVNDQKIVSYEMGDVTINQDYYVLRIPMSTGQRIEGTAQAGDIAIIFINDIPINDMYVGQFHEKLSFPFIIGEPGETKQLDIYAQIPPASITNLSASTGVNEGEVLLTWIAPGDDMYLGTATGYVVKYSSQPITNQTEFDNADTYSQSWMPKSSGEGEEHTITGLLGGKNYYFAVEAYDDSTLQASISNNPVYAVTADRTPPYAAGHNPEPSSIVSVDVNIYIELKDDGLGVYQNTIQMFVNGVNVLPQISAIVDGYSLTYNPPENFQYDQEITVSVFASDTAIPPNLMDIHTYSFQTTSGNAPWVSNLTITPENPTGNDSLTGSYEYHDPEENPESELTEIKWYKNGAVQTNYNNVLIIPSESVAKGDEWLFTVKPHDGYNYGQVQASGTLVIGNIPPAADNLKISPDVPFTYDELIAGYDFSDEDGDSEGVSIINWYKDGQIQNDHDNKITILPVYTAKTQVWYFTVKPYDGSGYGEIKTSSSVTIRNSSPVASNPLINPSVPLTNDNLSATYSYSDADNDPEYGSTIRWYKNEVIQSSYNNSKILPYNVTSKGQTWRFVVKPGDGIELGSYQSSPEVVIGNTPPAVSNVVLTPALPSLSDNLQVEYDYSDPDSDPESGTEIKWYKNGIIQDVYANSLVIPSAALAEGDQWYFTIKPKDNFDFGEIVTSNSVTVIVGNTPPVVSDLSITPASPNTLQDFTASYIYNDVDDDPESESTEIKWFKNNEAQPDFNDILTISAEYTNKDDLWYFTVKPHDGKNFGEIRTSSVVKVVNTPPVATGLTISPDSPLTGDNLVASYEYNDIDDDIESGSIIRWYKNNILQVEYNNLKTVYSTTTAKGDLWYFTIAPKDNTAFGETKNSGAVIIGNTPPSATNAVIIPEQPVTSDNLKASYNYSDVDGDPEEGSTIRWYKNNNIDSTYNDAEILPASATTKGQEWRFVIRPGDGATLGTYLSSPVIVIGNTPPVANAGEIYEAKPGETVFFNGSSSYDVDNDILEYHWDFGDGTKGVGKTITHIYEDQGVYNARLVVNDGSVDSLISKVDVYIGTDPSYVQQMTFELAEGWNLISFFAQSADKSLEAVLESIDGNYEAIWGYDSLSGEWQIYDPDNPPFLNTLWEIEIGKGYWIKMKTSDTLIVHGVKFSSPISLEAGWNLVGHNSENNLDLESFINLLGEIFVSIWTYDPYEKKWVGYSSGWPDFLERLEYLSPGKGYLLKVSASGVLNIEE